MSAPMSLDQIVREYLSLALVHPEKPPKTQRAERENTMLILGYNRAQETLRSILENHGDTEETRALADVRNEKQQQPTKVGDLKVWVAG